MLHAIGHPTSGSASQYFLSSFSSAFLREFAGEATCNQRRWSLSTDITDLKQNKSDNHLDSPLRHLHSASTQSARIVLSLELARGEACNWGERTWKESPMALHIPAQWVLCAANALIVAINMKSRLTQLQRGHVWRRSSSNMEANINSSIGQSEMKLSYEGREKQGSANVGV